jgi:hypothetical protein
MATPITLLPSSDNQVLVNTLKQANLENRVIRLMPGPHLTKPNHGEEIPINANGLHIKGTLSAAEFSTIKRPDNAIDLKASDNNYGLFFIPSVPTQQELDAIKNDAWIKFDPGPADPDDAKSFEFVVLIRGEITIENLELDCNMGNQQLPEKVPSENIEHSAMLGFVGRNKFKHPSKDEFFKNKFIYVSFKSVTINNIRVRRGGYADDIWISRGYHRPNIGKVIISNITSDRDNPVNPQDRINNKRSTITFSGLTQNVEITNAKITSLQAEETTRKHFADLPGEKLTDVNKFSRWKLKNVTCDVLDLAAKGKSIFLNADNVQTRKLTLFFETGGVLKNCTFKVPSQAVRLTRLNEIVFEKVNWIFEADNEGTVSGMSIVAQHADSCSAKFNQNTFRVEGPVSRGQFITTEYSKVEPANTVTLEFIKCIYDERIASSELIVAKVRERGTWKFTLSDFRGLPIEKVLKINPDSTTKTTAGIFKIIIV